MMRKNPRTLRGWARKYRRMHAYYIARYKDFEATADAYKERLIEAREEIAALKAARDRANAADWGQYDRALDQTTARELALFRASPAHIRYQQQRAAQEEKAPFSEAEKKRRLLQSGNWRAP